MPRNTPLRNRVKELRERLDVRQSELAREAGVTRQTVIAIEKGRLNPSILISLKIAKMLREPVDYIFYLQPGFDYEQEARENAGRPKRGRKKRTPVSPSAGAAPVVDSASYEAERDAAASDADEPEDAVTATSDAAEPTQVLTEAHDEPAHNGVQKGEDAKSGQAIWDFF
jgi:putative transcriptional regulator